MPWLQSFAAARVARKRTVMAAHEPHVSHKHVSGKEELTFRLSKICFKRVA